MLKSRLKRTNTNNWARSNSHLVEALFGRLDHYCAPSDGGRAPSPDGAGWSHSIPFLIADGRDYYSFRFQMPPNGARCGSMVVPSVENEISVASLEICGLPLSLHTLIKRCSSHAAQDRGSAEAVRQRNGTPRTSTGPFVERLGTREMQWSCHRRVVANRSRADPQLARGDAVAGNRVI